MQDITVQSLDNSSVLITEQKRNVPQNQVKYYIATKENADRFVNSKQNEENLNMFHKAVSAVLAVVSGVYLGAKMKTNALTRTIGGAAAAGGVYSGVETLDKYFDMQNTDIRVKRYELEEVTNDDIRVKKAIEQSKQIPAAEDTQSELTEKPE